MTQVLQIHSTADAGDQAVRQAAAVIRRGGLVAFPTETVYGLGADGLSAVAVRSIFTAKGRPADNPLILHAASVEEVIRITARFPDPAARLAAAFWPGPLTMVLDRARIVPPETSAGLPTIAVRIPAHPAARALIQAAGVPIAAPSANLSGRPSPTTAAHVLADLGGRIDLILDAGPTTVGLESTVVDLTAPVPRLLRPGAVTADDLRGVLGRDGLDLSENEAGRPVSPGMKYRHYAPKAPLTIVEGPDAPVLRWVAGQLAAAKNRGERVAALVHSEDAAALSGLAVILDLGPRRRPDIAGQRLFSLLRFCDEQKVDAVLAVRVADEGVGYAVMNRLRKAAGERRVLIGRDSIAVEKV